MRDKIPRADIYLGFEIICARLRLPLHLKSYKSLLERREKKTWTVVEREQRKGTNKTSQTRSPTYSK